MTDADATGLFLLGRGQREGGAKGSFLIPRTNEKKDRPLRRSAMPRHQSPSIPPSSGRSALHQIAGVVLAATGRALPSHSATRIALLDGVEAVFGLSDLMPVVLQHFGCTNAHESRVVDYQNSCHV